MLKYQKKIIIEREQIESLRKTFETIARALIFCEQCGKRSLFLSLDEAVDATLCTTREIVGMVERGEIHFHETKTGFLLVCEKSLPNPTE